MSKKFFSSHALGAAEQLGLKCLLGSERGVYGGCGSIWKFQREELQKIPGIRFVALNGVHPISFAEIIRAWQDDSGFRLWFNAELAGASFSAFRWETPSVTATTVSRLFEFVLLDSPMLARRPDPEAFATHFSSAERNIATFPNLGGDAIMIVPCPIAAPSAYAHLAAFVRQAPEDQRHSLWQTVGAAMAQHVGEEPIWLSTAGAGVSWLHVRLDRRPKYYGFAPYKQRPI